MACATLRRTPIPPMPIPMPCYALRYPAASPSQSNQSHPNHSLIIDLPVQSTINTIQTILIIDFLVLLTYSIGATTSQGRFPKACKVVPCYHVKTPGMLSQSCRIFLHGAKLQTKCCPKKNALIATILAPKLNRCDKNIKWFGE